MDATRPSLMIREAASTLSHSTPPTVGYHLEGKLKTIRARSEKAVHTRRVGVGAILDPVGRRHEPAALGAPSIEGKPRGTSRWASQAGLTDKESVDA